MKLKGARFSIIHGHKSKIVLAARMCGAGALSPESCCNCLNATVGGHRCSVDYPTEGERIAMVKRCANPECSASFHSLRDGRVFVIEVEGDSPGHARQRQPRYFWLCNACCRTMTVVADKGHGIKVAPHRCIHLGESSMVHPIPGRSV
jgi:hypothetical protein